MKVIAHRGACTEGLENSWEAFYHAVDSGADRIELDIHLTKDKHLIVMHDEDLQRTASRSDLITNLKRSEIEKTCKLNNGESIPFLDEVFDKLLDRIEINVEVKSAGSQTVEVLADLIGRQRCQHKIIVSSFSSQTIALLCKDYREIRTAYLWEKNLYFAFAFRLGPFNFMRQNSIRIFHPDARLVSASMVRAIKAEGWEIYPYVGLKYETKREELWAYLSALGVDGLCTNFPREMKLWLQEVQDDSKRFDQVRTMANRIS